MKLHLILILGCVWGAIACSHEKPEFYKGGNYIQFWVGEPDASIGYVVTPKNYPRINSNQLYDTAWLRVQVVGEISPRDRRIKFEQYDQEDAYYTQAVAGVNYVPFDDPELQKYMVIPADSSAVNIPVVVKYDVNTKASINLYLRLLPTEDFELGQVGWTKAKVSYSNY